MEKQGSGRGLCTASLVLGILSIVFCWWPSDTVAVICGIVGIILGAIGRKRALAAGEPAGTGTAGLVLSIIGTSICSLWLLSCLLCLGAGCSIAGAFGAL